MAIRKTLLTALGVPDARVQKYLPQFKTVLSEHGIDTDLRVAHFLAQVMHESGKLRWIRENLNYSTDALLRVFGTYYSSRQTADRDARQPERIGSVVYANRMGNGPPESGDGFRYRGRGFIQLTGKSNYRQFSQWIGEDVAENPDLVATRYPVHSAVHYWVKRKINIEADRDDIDAVTKKINGGLNGLASRVALLAVAKQRLRLGVERHVLDRPTHRIKPNRLNLRSEPRVHPETRVGGLARGDEVRKVGSAKVAGWVRIRALVNGHLMRGFVASRFLEPL